MLWAIKMRKLILILLILTSKIAFAQVDSLNNVKSKLINSFRFGIGVEKNPYIEIGFSRLGIADKGLNSGSICYYFAGQINRTFSESNTKYIYGGKIGFESAWMIGMWGAEVKYLTEGIRSQWYFTPKVGLSLLGTASLLYGINLPRKHTDLEEVGQHQISLTMNLSKKTSKEFR